MDRIAELILELAREHERPRRMDAAAERRQDAHADVAELVAEALDRDRAIGRHRVGLRALIREVLDEVAGGERGRVDTRRRATRAPHPRLFAGRAQPARLHFRGEHAVELAAERTERAAELDRPPGTVGAPERHLAGLAGSRADDHAIARDVLDPPGRRAEDERLALAALGDHLLVELADARAAGAEVHRVEAAIRDRAAGDDRQQARAFAADQHVGLAIPGQPRPELGELVRRIAPREHVEHARECRACELAITRGTPDHALELGDRPRLGADHRDDLLREDVERAVGHADRLDVAGEHPASDHRSLQQVAAELREDPADAGPADVVPRAADPLQPARDRARRLDLEHEIDRAHVDAELERRGRGDRAQPAGFQRLLDLDPLMARDRAVMRAHQLDPRGRHPAFDRELGELLRDALREPSRVDEDDGRAIGEDPIEQRRIDQRPHAAAVGSGRAGRVHVRRGHDELEIERRPRAGVDHLDRPVPAQISSDFDKWTLGGRKPNALRLGIARTRSRGARAAPG